MNKKDVLKLLDVVSFIAMINGTVFVLLFQNLSGSMLLYISLISYIIAFTSYAAICVFKLLCSFKVEVDDEFYLKTKQKVWVSIQLVCSLALIILSALIFIVW